MGNNIYNIIKRIIILNLGQLSPMRCGPPRTYCVWASFDKKILMFSLFEFRKTLTNSISAIDYMGKTSLNKVSSHLNQIIFARRL